MNKVTNTHDVCYIVDIEKETAQAMDLGYHGIGF
jgi:hypothetical protein